MKYSCKFISDPAKRNLDTEHLWIINGWIFHPRVTFWPSPLHFVVFSWYYTRHMKRWKHNNRDPFSCPSGFLGPASTSFTLKSLARAVVRECDHRGWHDGFMTQLWFGLWSCIVKMTRRTFRFVFLKNECRKIKKKKKDPSLMRIRGPKSIWLAPLPW